MSRCRALYEHWLTVAAARPDQVAVREGPHGKAWTFAALADAAAARPRGPDIVPAGGRGLPFLLDVLCAWRDGAVLVPLDSGTAAPPLPDLPAAIGHVKTTSGSSGTPRHVLFTAEQLAADAHQILTTMGLRPAWPNLAVLSMAHSYGFSNLVLPLLLHGIPLVLLENPLPETLRQTLDAVGSVTIPGAPALWRAWRAAGAIDSRIALAISAGAPLPASLEQEIFDASGVKIHNFYGSSECGGIAYDRTLTPRTEAALAGTAMDGVALAVDAASGSLTVRSAAVGRGYLIPDAALAGGVFTTADLVSLSADGVRILGRTGDAINIAGRKVSPSTVEEKLLTIPGVRHCVVFGVPSADATRVEEIVGVIHPEPGTTLTTIQSAAAAALLPGTLPRHWLLTTALTPDARGKIPRHAWKQRWLAGDPWTQ